MMITRSPERIPIQSPKERKAEVHIKYFVTINKSYFPEKNEFAEGYQTFLIIISEDHSSGESDSDGGSGMPQCQQS